ncbi:Disease resistance protein [Melia azedarach]|uniref:Disease resistance protein n=1 Tax=Melia azedarach TaxID=155640 RepID=A0ACC1YEC0_MELAZ|nr:Disease resistance protein [Melia azedarach]
MAEIVSIAIEIVKCIAKYIAPCARRRIGYLREYRSNFEKLKTEVEKLKNERTSIQQLVDAAKRNVEEIEENVQKWLEGADEFDKKAQELLQRAGKKVIPSEERSREDEEETAARKRCFKGLCLKTRYQLSKEVVALLEDVDQHLKACKFVQISHPVILKDPQLYIKDYEAFESRASLLTEIISSLKDAGVNIVGIYGMGGIGKTTLAKGVANHLETNKFFDSVIFVEITEKPDKMQIQRRIGERLLGLKLSEQDSESNRAAKLCERLKQEKSILIILDNIWGHLDLQAIGIPDKDQHKGCKLLLTGRFGDILSSQMDSQRNFKVEFLDDEEAWNLFKKMSDCDYNNGSELESVAREVVNICAHLPIVIVTLARALRNNKQLFEWEEALRQMKMSSQEIIQCVHVSLELSYKHLESEVLQKTLLLIRYANLTSTDELLLYGMALGLFEGINKMEERRVRAQALVQKLKYSCLLLDGNTSGEDFSMHDVVRDVILNIASRDRRAFTNERVAELKWPDERTLNAYPSVVLKDVKPGELPPVLECQHLKLLCISATAPGFHPVSYSSLNIGNDFFTRMTELKVLVLANMDLSSLPESICFLSNLQALCLYNCKLDVVAIPKELTKLEILSLRNTKVQRLSAEVHHLIRLKSLDLRCTYVEVIPPNVISSLSTLEELYMNDRFEWEKQGLDKARKNASLSELKDLSKLTCLEIKIKDADALPTDLSFQTLERYKITIASQNDTDWIWRITAHNSCRKFYLWLTDTNICLNDGHIMQLKGIQDLCLAGLQDMKSILYELDRSGFPQLKYLQVQDNDNLLCIVDSMEHVTLNVFPILESLLLNNLVNLGKICRRQLTAAESSFSQLRKIEVKKCHKLDNIFLLSIVRRLQLLESIDVSDCKNMKCVFGIEGGDEFRNNSEVTENIKLSKLRSLTLKFLPTLRSFYSKLKIPSQQRRDEIILEDGVSVSHILFIEEVALPDLEILELRGINIQTIWQNQVAAVSSGVKNLTSLTIDGCKSLTCLFSSSIASNFIRLQYLDISSCQALQKIVVLDEGDYIEFPSLKKLTMQKCPKLKQFMGESTNTDHLKEITLAFFNEKVALPNLESLVLSDCDSLRCLFSSSVAKSFVLPRRISLSKCLALEVIFDMEGVDSEDKGSAVVSQLTKLDISDLPKLRHVWNKEPQELVSFQNLKNIQISGCDVLKNIFPASIASSLSQLESLGIRECGVEEIVFVADQEGAETCKSAVDKGDCIEFPSLKELCIRQCPKLKKFMVKKARENELTLIPLSFFNEKVALPNLESLNLSDCDSLRCLFSSSVAKSFVRPRRLSLSKCLALEVIFDMEGANSEDKGNAIVSQLTKLDISDLPKLRHVWNKEPQELVSFQNLKDIWIGWCDVLENIFPASIASSLSHLESLRIRNCGVEEIVFVANQEGAETCTSAVDKGDCIEFPSLKELYIRQCPKLKEFVVKKARENELTLIPLSFFNEKVALPNLESLVLSDCDSLRCLFSSSVAKSFVRLQYLKIFECLALEVIFDMEGADSEDKGSAVVSQLTELDIFNLPKLRHVWNKEPQELASFQNLKDIWISGCDVLENIFPASIASSLSQLESLGIRECGVEEIVFVADQEGAETCTSAVDKGDCIEFPSLKELCVRQCPKLKEFVVKNTRENELTLIPLSFFNEKVALPNLESLNLSDCDSLRCLFSSSVAKSFVRPRRLSLSKCLALEVIFDMEGANSEDKGNAIVSQLTKLDISDLPKLRHVWNKEPQELVSFQNLKDIQISGCDVLKNIFPASIASSLSQLESLGIRECGVEEIVFVADQEGAETCTSAVDKGDCIEFPSLKELYIRQCPKLKEFVVKKARENELTLIPLSFFNEKVALPNLESLNLSDCDSLRCLFSSSVAKRFVRPRRLSLSKCLALEVIFDMEGADSEEKGSAVVSQLTQLDISDLPKLRHVWNKEPQELASFQNLKDIWISGCDVLENIFPASIASSLSHLESLRIRNCGMEEIVFVADQEGAEICTSAVDKGDCIEFPSLKELYIRQCPKLKEFVVKNTRKNELTLIPLSFFNEKVVLPNLENLLLEDCNSLQCLFSSSIKNFVRLKYLEISECPVLEVVFDSLESDVDGLPKLKHVRNKDPQKLLSFEQLKRVSINGCGRLKNVFPMPIAGSLSRLESLEITECGVEEVVYVANQGGAETNARFVFPRVVYLRLHDLPNFKMFCPGVYTTEWPELKELEVSDWEIAVNILKSNKDGLPYILFEKVSPKLEKLKGKGKGIAAILQFPEDLFCKLKYLIVTLDESNVIISLDFLHSFHHMKMLSISGESVTFSEKEVENGMSVQILNLNAHLKHIWKEAADVDHLVHLHVGICDNLINNLLPSSACFRNLTTLRVWGCEGLTNIVTSSTAQSLVQLREMTIESCKMLAEVVAGDEGDDHEAKNYEIVFSQLKKLHLSYLESLTSFCSANYSFQFPSLEDLVVENCRRMNSFSRGELSTPELQRVKYFRWHFHKWSWKGDLNTTIRELHEESLKNIR